MLMYMFNPDRDGDMVRDALVERARGVDVKLLIDGFGSGGDAEVLHRARRGAAASIACSIRATAGVICCATTRS